MSQLHSVFSRWRDYLTPASNTSNFTKTGELTPEEFVAAGDYLCYKFPTWSWAPADPSKRVSYLPEDKQYLVLKHAPCHTRLDDNFARWNPGDEEDWDEGGESEGKVPGKVKAVAESADMDEECDTEDEDTDDEIPDMDDEDDDEAIIRDSSNKSGKGVKAPLRYYNLYLTYTTFFRVPRFYISGFDGASNVPLHPPTVMFEDIAPDYREKTVTIEPFPCLDAGIQMASVHPCKHAETMKRIFDGMARRKARREVEASGIGGSADEIALGEVNDIKEPEATKEGEDWEQVAAEDEDCLRIDQYLVAFVKFMAGVMPGVEMDYTMGI